jgi:hypothetical protein
MLRYMLDNTVEYLFREKEAHDRRNKRENKELVDNSVDELDENLRK